MAQEPKRAPHLLSHQEDRLWQWVESYVQPRADRRKHGRVRGAVLQPYSTGEGGEPQGSGNGRPRNPLEGRGKQAYESAERKHNEALNSERLCLPTSTE